MLCKSASSCRPIASPACGQTVPSRRTSSSIPAISIRPCRRPPPSATTGCRRRCRVTSCRIHSRMAVPRSARAGSSTVSTRDKLLAATPCRLRDCRNQAVVAAVAQCEPSKRRPIARSRRAFRRQSRLPEIVFRDRL